MPYFYEVYDGISKLDENRWENIGSFNWSIYMGYWIRIISC